MDLLQEINNRIRSESSRVWGKLYNIAYDATIGLAKLYQKKTLQLVKITAASAYLQLLKTTRKHAILLALAIFAVVLLAVAVVVVPVALVLVTPWSTTVKVIELVALGAIYIGAVLACLQNVFSEEKWMKASGFQELMDSISTDEP